MIVSAGLKSSVYGAIYGSDKQQDALNKLASALSSYITANLEIQGTYIGVSPTGSPSPLSGPHIWKCTFNITGSMILPFASAGDTTFGLGVLSLSQFLIPTSFDGMVNLLAPVALSCNISPTVNTSKADKSSDAWDLLASDICLGFTTSLPIPTSCPAMGTDGSIGNVTLVKMS